MPLCLGSLPATGLLELVHATSARALAAGTLAPIATTTSVHPDSGIPFLLHTLSGPRKPTAREPTAPARAPQPGSTPKKRFNPFLPYEPSLFVAAAPPAHVVLLNKFPVVADHLLLVTSAYEAQSSLLTAADLNAAWAVLAEVDGLAFYNAGGMAGASQHHKHLQVVPTPLARLEGGAGQGNGDADGGDSGGDGGGRTPVEAALRASASATKCGDLYTVGAFPFAHAACRVDDIPHRSSGDGVDAGAVLMERYTRMLHTFLRDIPGLAEAGDAAGGGAADVDETPATAVADADAQPGIDDDGAPWPSRPIAGGRSPFPYNLLLTREHLWVVPRRAECVGDVSLNSLAYAGAMLVRDAAQAEAVLEGGGVAALAACAFPRS
ncbi:hypothetical protein MMPV_005443 [Pyropia vietnamensis]